MLKKIKTTIAVLLLLSATAEAQVSTQQPCLPDETLVCTILLDYDTGGNRTVRKEACACVALPNRPQARAARPDAQAQTVGTANAAGSESVSIVKLYPNPTAGSVHLDLSVEVSAGTIVRIIDALGTVVGEQMVQGNSIEVNLQNYPQGAYLLVLQGRILKQTQRIIKL